MKNKLLPLAALVLPLALALTLLAGCAQPAGSLPTTTPTADPTPEAEEAVARCRIVDGAGESTMLLAEEDGSIMRLGAGTEELAVTVSVGDVFLEVTHTYPDLTIHLTLFHASIAEGTPQKLEHNDIRWITVDEIPQYEFCPADQVILAKLMESGGQR